MSLQMRKIMYGYPGERKKVLNKMDLEILDGDIYALLGGSGSGKTTALNLIAGFLQPLKGTVVIKGKDVTKEKVHKRNIGIVFQEYALFPHMSVEANIGFGLRTRNIPSSQLKTRISDMVEIVGLDGFEKKFPSELSGGERQRVALSRALVYEPDLLLMDEPLSALDASLREGLRKELRNILKRTDTTVLYVTHDQMEAIAVSDRVGFLSRGRIYEEGSPEAIYWHPRRIKTAEFMGVTNILKVNGNNSKFIRTEIGELPWDRKVPSKVGFRPESFRSDGEGITFRCHVVNFEYRGKEIIADLLFNGSRLKGSIDGRKRLEKGGVIDMVLNPAELIPFE